MASKPSSNRRLVLKPGDKWHGFEGLAENHVLVDPIKVTILTPGLSADGTMQDIGIPAGVVTKFLSSRRIEIEKTGLYSFLVLFSMGITKGKWSTLITELLNFKDLYDANAPLNRVLPALVEAHPEAYANGSQGSVRADPRVYREDKVPRAQRDMYTVLPEMAMRPADAYEQSRARAGGERRDRRADGTHPGRHDGALSAGHPGDHARRADHRGDQVDPGLSPVRAGLRQQVPGIRDRHTWTALRTHPANGRRYLVDCIA